MLTASVTAQLAFTTAEMHHLPNPDPHPFSLVDRVCASENGGGGNQLCLKDVPGTGGGVQQGGHDSNDFVVPTRREH